MQRKGHPFRLQLRTGILGYDRMQLHANITRNRIRQMNDMCFTIDVTVPLDARPLTGSDKVLPVRQAPPLSALISMPMHHHLRLPVAVVLAECCQARRPDRDAV